MYSAVLFQQVMQRRLEPWRWGAQQSAIGSWQPPIERIIEADPLTTTWEVAEELSVDHSMVVQHLKQTGKAKKLNKWMPHEFTKKKKKNFCFEVLSSLILCNNNEPFLDQIVVCNKKWIFYDNHEWPAQCLDQETPKHLSKPNLYQKRSQVTAWWFSVGMIHYSFLNLSETITPEKYAQKLMRCTENWNAWSWHWSTVRAQFFPMTTSNCTLHIPHSKSLTNWVTKFCLICHIQLTCCQPTIT